MIQLVELPYFENSADLFSSFSDDEWSIFLDSGYPSGNAGRYDILVTEPIATVVSNENITTVTTQSSTSKHDQPTSPFKVLQATIDRYAKEQSILNQDTLPFHGGALGYLGYDLARSIETLPNIANDAEQLPQMAMGIYTWAIVVDHQQEKSYLTGEVCKKDSKWTWERLVYTFNHSLPQKEQEEFVVTSPLQSNLEYSQYQKVFRQIKRYIVAGDCYQINLAQRFSASASGNPWSAYQQLRKLNPAPFSAYINSPFGQILSSSPERFLKITQNKVETKPIKGTRPRSTNLNEDKKQIEALRSSPKDHAENVMIVDLLRNDIGRVCDIGSVSVPKLFDIESYSTVHHLVSTVQGNLATNKDAIDLLSACFPGGSITGAPKVRAMEIIESLEPHRRGIYCGAIGYIDFNGNMDTNIAIRTLVYNQSTIRYWVGGGIVHDSKMEEEYQETLDKGKALLELLNNCSR